MPSAYKWITEMERLTPANTAVKTTSDMKINICVNVKVYIETVQIHINHVCLFHLPIVWW